MSIPKMSLIDASAISRCPNVFFVFHDWTTGFHCWKAWIESHQRLLILGPPFTFWATHPKLLNQVRPSLPPDGGFSVPPFVPINNVVNLFIPVPQVLNYNSYYWWIDWVAGFGSDESSVLTGPPCSVHHYVLPCCPSGWFITWITSDGPVNWSRIL